MKKLKFLVVIVFAASAITAFATNKSVSAPPPQMDGYARTAIPQIPCQYSQTLDNNWICSNAFFGQICTISGRTAYPDAISCNNNWTFNALRRQ